jgi:hypothetical protein
VARQLDTARDPDELRVLVRHYRNHGEEQHRPGAQARQPACSEHGQREPKVRDGAQLPRQPTQTKAPRVLRYRDDACRVCAPGAARHHRQQEPRHTDQRDAVNREIEEQRMLEPRIGCGFGLGFPASHFEPVPAVS